MNRRDLLNAFAGAVLCPVCTVAAEKAHWSYQGATGPDQWGSLDTADRACSVGDQQSPIDVGETIKAQLPPLEIAWGPNPDTIINNGHTIEVNCPTGGALTVGMDKYALKRFHFHRPSEHLVAGKKFPMEAHFVHQSASGSLAVVGALIEAGKANPVFARVVATMPQTAGPAVKADPAINPNGLLPSGHDYYLYSGSLTTPPCSETVSWLLLTNPIEVAAADIAGFAKLYPMNARPVQSVNRRFVLRSA
jgi:carbonic anhydrase